MTSSIDQTKGGGFLLLLLAILLFVAGLMVRPFLGYVTAAALLAFVLTPLQDVLSEYVGGGASAFILMALAFVVILIPTALVVRYVAEDAQELIDDMDGVNKDGDDNGEYGGDSRADKVVDVLDRWSATIEERTGVRVDLRDQAVRALSRFATATTSVGGVSHVLDVLSGLVVGLGVVLFTLFYLLKDGRRFVTYVRDAAPLPDATANDLLRSTHRIAWAVIKNHVLVAIVQGLVAGVGLWLFGVPNYVFWTFVMTLTAFVPVVGTFLVWGPAALYLATIAGAPAAGLALALYGAVVVALTDNVLRAAFMSFGNNGKNDKETQLHPALVLIGVIGGVYVFGASGLLIGPVIFGVLKAVLEAF